MTTSGPAVGQQGIEPESEDAPAAEHVTRVILVLGPPGAGQPTLGRWLEGRGHAVLGMGAHPQADPQLSRYHEQVLREAGATPWAPPELDGSGAVPEPGLRASDADALGAIHAVPRGDRPDATSPFVVWVQPTNALLLPALRRILPAPIVVVAWRSPEATVAALGTDGVVAAHAVALWEAHLVHALRGASGLPMIGLDLDDPVSALARLEELLTELGVPVSGEATARRDSVTAELATAGTAFGSGGDPELAALTGAVEARLAPVLAAAAGAHAAWEAPDDLVVGPTSAALLGAHRAAHRAALDAVAAWAAVHEAQMAAQDAKAAVEREHRELVGPDPTDYRELRRELWRLRDEFAGIVAGRTNYHVAWTRADAARLAAEQRVADLLMKLDELESIRSHRDEMLGSERWRIGGLVLDPLKRFRRPNPER